VFGFAIEDIDFKGGWIHVNRQVRFVRTKPVFAQPKSNKVRSVPLPDQIAVAIKAHMKEFPPVEVTLPWGKPGGEPKSFRLLFIDKKGRACNRSVFNMGDWQRAFAVAGVIPPRERGARYLQAAQEDGMHALRHAYASVLLDAGESIKALSEYLGHSNPGPLDGPCPAPKGRGPKTPPEPTKPQLRATQGNKADAPPHATDG
jgi:integrase